MGLECHGGRRNALLGHRLGPGNTNVAPLGSIPGTGWVLPGIPPTQYPPSQPSRTARTHVLHSWATPETAVLRSTKEILGVWNTAGTLRLQPALPPALRLSSPACSLAPVLLHISVFLSISQYFSV